jgi:hypothetical protein
LSAPSNKPNESIDDPPVNQWENPVLGEKTLFTDYAIMRIILAMMQRLLLHP